MKTTLLLCSFFALQGCLIVEPAATEGCSNTCEYAFDGECDDGGEGSLYSLCSLGTDCNDCGSRASAGTPTRPGMTTDPEPPEPVTIDYGIPADFPALSERYSTHATWRQDTSGFESIPNSVFASVSDIPVSEGVFEAGVGTATGMHRIDFFDASRNYEWKLELRSMEVGTYTLSGFDGSLERVENRGGSYRYISDIDGGSGAAEIVGNNGIVAWGTFTARLCYAPTPGSNCSTTYSGRFSVLL